MAITLFQTSVPQIQSRIKARWCAAKLVVTEAARVEEFLSKRSR